MAQIIVSAQAVKLTVNSPSFRSEAIGVPNLLFSIHTKHTKTSTRFSRVAHELYINILTHVSRQHALYLSCQSINQSPPQSCPSPASSLVYTSPTRLRSSVSVSIIREHGCLLSSWDANYAEVDCFISFFVRSFVISDRLRQTQKPLVTYGTLYAIPAHTNI